MNSGTLRSALVVVLITSGCATAETRVTAIRTDKLGFRGRLEAYLSDALTVGVSISQDPLFGTNLALAAAYTIGANWQPLRPFCKRTVQQRMFDQVGRT